MYNQSDKPFEGMSGMALNIAVEKGHIKVIALGEAAKKYLLKAGINEFFVLPHPSGRNHLLNNKKFVKQTLEQCRTYIYQSKS
jgi:uracil-DNA glycosylase